jgi:hypothetical protein
MVNAYDVLRTQHNAPIPLRDAFTTKSMGEFMAQLKTREKSEHGIQIL